MVKVFASHKSNGALCTRKYMQRHTPHNMFQVFLLQTLTRDHVLTGLREGGSVVVKGQALKDPQNP